jgi:hypothetical protein
VSLSFCLSLSNLFLSPEVFETNETKCFKSTFNQLSFISIRFKRCKIYFKIKKEHKLNYVVF